MNLDFSNIKVLLVGDFMIDNYIIGKSNRMSPEAPVPVINIQKEYSIPGGAGNVAMNLSKLGANVTCCGNVGDDRWGKKLVSLLTKEGISTEGIETVKNHSTTLKERIYLGNKQIARIDSEEIKDWQPKANNFIYKDSNYDIVIVSDYNKGAINHLQNEWLELGEVLVDPKKNSFKNYKGATIVTPNLNELKKVSSMNIENDTSIINICSDLINKYDFKYILAKKGDQGMILVGKNNFVKNIDAHSVDNADVTGAGDTVISTLSLCYAKTRDIEFSAEVANAAAAIAVSKPGTASVQTEEIKNLLSK